MTGAGITWSASDDPDLGSWCARLPSRTVDEIVVEWQDAVLNAGRRSEIYVMVDGRTALGRFGPNDPRSASSRETIFELLPPGSVETTIKVFDDDDRVVSLSVRSLGELNDLSITWYGTGSVPISIDTEYEVDLTSEVENKVSGINVYFALGIDLWLPWTRAVGQPGYRSGEWVDNRQLAALNAPRLNAFLDSARAATVTAAGRWSFEGSSLYGHELDDNGVILDAPDPR